MSRAPDSLVGHCVSTVGSSSPARGRSFRLPVLVVCALVAGCPSSSDEPDAAQPDAAEPQVEEPRDAGLDAGDPREDGGPDPADAGVVDAGRAPVDGGVPDAGPAPEDAGPPSCDPPSPASLPPTPGALKSLVASGDRTCAIDAVSERVVCWGSSLIGTMEVPDVAADGLAVSGGSACLTDEEGAVHCWGAAGGINPSEALPSPSFAAPPKQVALAVGNGTNTGCAITEADTLECWGANDYGLRDPPAGQFAKVAGGPQNFCGIGLDGQVTCWGYGAWGIKTEPVGVFTDVAVFDGTACALTTGGLPTCWGGSNEPIVNSAPNTPLTTVAVGWAGACGIAAGSGAIVCWGTPANFWGFLAAVPPGTFTDVSIGHYHACATREDGIPVCWGHNFEGQTIIPAGPYVDVQVVPGANNRGRRCALSHSGRIVCWGDESQESGYLHPPEGAFSKMALGPSHACAIGVDGDMACWGDAPEPSPVGAGPDAGQSDPGPFTDIAVAQGMTCGLLAGGGVSCWGDEPEAPVPPEGPFDSLVSSMCNYICGVQPGGGLTCWGDSPAELAGLSLEGDARLDVWCEEGCTFTETDTACWNVALPPTPGGVRDIDVGEAAACVTSCSGAASCTGLETPPLAGMPTGPFSMVSVDGTGACGLELATGAVRCWGNYMNQAYVR